MFGPCKAAQSNQCMGRTVLPLENLLGTEEKTTFLGWAVRVQGAFKKGQNEVSVRKGREFPNNGMTKTTHCIILTEC